MANIKPGRAGSVRSLKVRFQRPQQRRHSIVLFSGEGDQGTCLKPNRLQAFPRTRKLRLDNGNGKRRNVPQAEQIRTDGTIRPDDRMKDNTGGRDPGSGRYLECLYLVKQLEGPTTSKSKVARYCFREERISTAAKKRLTSLLSKVASLLSKAEFDFPAIDTRPFGPPMLRRTLLKRLTGSPCFPPYAKEN